MNSVLHKKCITQGIYWKTPKKRSIKLRNTSVTKMRHTLRQPLKRSSIKPQSNPGKKSEWELKVYILGFKTLPLGLYPDPLSVPSFQFEGFHWAPIQIWAIPRQTDWNHRTQYDWALRIYG